MKQFTICIEIVLKSIITIIDSFTDMIFDDNFYLDPGA